MNGFALEITLKDDCVLSERSATEGGHRALDYIPGGALLGAAASRLYGLLKQHAFLIFHSGKVRFGNALPVTPDGSPTWPVPFAWHHAKGETPAKNDHFVRGSLRQLYPGEEMPDGKQPQQLRRGYVSRAGHWVKPETRLRVKTAIDPRKARAREAALFGYDALPAGTRLIARIEADQDVSSDLIDELRKALTYDELLFGRSRSAEYGRAEARVVEAQRIEHGKVNRGETTLWLLSDLAAPDAYGQPTLFPEPEWLGLPKGELLVDRSFIRSRRYSPWNGYRGGPDVERQVIIQGSVLRFKLTETVSSNHQERVEGGLGVNREAGLGAVWLNPSLLASVEPEFDAICKTSPSDKRLRPDTLLIAWLEEQMRAQESRADVLAKARKLADQYVQMLRSARRLKGLADRDEIGPSASQWGGVLAAAKARGNDLTRDLFDDNNGVCKVSLPGWRDEFFDEGETKTFATWAKQVLGTTPDRRLTQHLAREIQDRIKKEGRR